MKTLYLDCGMGAAGDMLAAALLELMPDPDAALARLNSFGIPGVAYAREKMSRCGIAGTHLAVTVHGEEEGKGHHHEHHGLHDILHLVEHHLNLPDAIRPDVAAVYRLLADAESRAHGCPVDEIHFHEVGALDAVADIAAVCWLMSEIAPDEVVVSPVHVGSGTVECAHGILPVPAPATAFLLETAPSYSDGNVQCELCTPTGAALLRHFASRFGAQPMMRVTAIGYGVGRKDIPGRANILRAALGESVDASSMDEVLELSCNIDDMTGEEMSFACERIFAAGAKDVLTLPACMKKGRSGMLLQVLCSETDAADVVAAMFRHTTTIGIRETRCRRYVMTRREETVALPDGTALRKKVSEGFGVRRAKIEHEDLARAARASGKPLREVADAASTL